MAEATATQTKPKPKKEPASDRDKYGNYKATINGREDFYSENQITVAMKSQQTDIKFPENTTFSKNVKHNKCRTCGKR